MTRGPISKRRPTSRRFQSEPHLETAVPRPEVVLLTGESGIGKTTYCTRIITFARKQNLDVAGLLTLPRSSGGLNALDVEDIRTGERRLLAEGVGAAKGPSTEKWRFHPESLDWGNEVLRRAVPCDLLLIDELGPLELLRKEGWTAAAEVFKTGMFRMAVFVVRPTLLAAFHTQWGNLRYRILELNTSNRRELKPGIKALLGARP